MDGKSGEFPAIAKITPSDRKGATISVNTNLSAVNKDDDFDRDSKLAAIALDPVLGVAQGILAGLDRTKTVLDEAVNLLNALIKNHPTAAITSASFDAVVDSDKAFNHLALTFAGLVVAQKGNVEVSSGQIGAEATFNGREVPITFQVQGTGKKGNPLTVDGVAASLAVQLLRGVGAVTVDEATRGVLSISPVALIATERGTLADSFSAIALTNWTTTVSTIPEPPTLVLCCAGAVLLSLRRSRVSFGGERRET